MKTGTPKKYSFSLGDISDLLDNKLAIFEGKFDKNLSRRFAQNNVAIYAELDKRFGEVDKRFAEIDKRFDQINKRFDENDDAHQAILKAVGEMTDKKIAKHCVEKHALTV